MRSSNRLPVSPALAIGLAAAVLLTSAAAAGAEIATRKLRPRDTFLNIDAINYSSNPLLATYTWPDYQMANAIVMRFDLSTLPAGSTVQEATLHVALVESDTAPENAYTISAHKIVGKNPAISRATGYTSDGTTPWTPNACCYDNVPLAQADISPAYDRQTIDKTPGFKTLTLTTMVQEWVANPTANRGLVLTSDETLPRDRYRLFASMEHPDTAVRPYLEVQFSAPDSTPPTVSMTSPQTGATVSGAVTVTASATDDVAVAGVQFALDGADLGAEDTGAPFAVTWNTAEAVNGPHSLTARARDAAGNQATSAASTVTVDNAASTTEWANEPAGLTLLTDWGLDESPPTAGDVLIPGSPGWRVVANAAPGSAGGWAARVSDSTAPFSPTNVFDFVYPQGMLEGEAPATVYYNLSGNELYAGFWWKASSPFDTGPNGNKIAFLFNGGGDGGGQQFLILMPDRRLHVLPEYPGDYRWRTPNVSPTVVTLGVWHRIEWHSNRVTGALKWWLDGVLQGSYTDVRSSHPFDVFQFSPTWGGNSGARKQQTDHYWFDHVRLSVR